jgi:hypothetical protein
MVFQALFFAALLILYYAVLVQRNPNHIMPLEIALIIFFCSFAVDEFSSMRDSGVTFYAADFWSWLDMAIMSIAVAFLSFRESLLHNLIAPVAIIDKPIGIAGVVKDSDSITDTAFDILSLEALLLVPR